MSFGLSFEKLMVIGIIAVFLLGPDRLPYYASQLARLVRNLRDMANTAKDRMRDEMGPEFDDVDWKKLDPRQYDPRRIIREALTEDDTPVATVKKSSMTIPPASSASIIAAAAASSAADSSGTATDSGSVERAGSDEGADAAEGAATAAASVATTPVVSAAAQRKRLKEDGVTVPFDTEAT